MLEILISEGNGPGRRGRGCPDPGPPPGPAPRAPAHLPRTTVLFSVRRSSKSPVCSQAVDCRWGAALPCEFGVPCSLHGRLQGGTAACDYLEEGETRLRTSSHVDKATQWETVAQCPRRHGQASPQLGPALPRRPVSLRQVGHGPAPLTLGAVRVRAGRVWAWPPPPLPPRPPAPSSLLPPPS